MRRDVLLTRRLRLRRPVAADAAAIFERYAADAEVTRYMSWARHRTLADTLAFVAFSDAEWARSQAGPYLIESDESGRLLGSTGLSVRPGLQAITGYILARDSWGQGFASEALAAMVRLAGELGLASLHAACHAEHRVSSRVLEKCGFVPEGEGATASLFPNLGSEPQPTLAYVRRLD